MKEKVVDINDARIYGKYRDFKKENISHNQFVAEFNWENDLRSINLLCEEITTYTKAMYTLGSSLGIRIGKEGQYIPIETGFADGDLLGEIERRFAINALSDIRFLRIILFSLNEELEERVDKLENKSLP